MGCDTPKSKPNGGALDSATAQSEAGVSANTMAGWPAQTAPGTRMRKIVAWRGIENLALMLLTGRMSPFSLEEDR